MNNIILIGGGGHCKSVLDTILDLNEFTNIKILDLDINKKVLNINISGTDNDLLKFYHEGYTNAFVTLGSIQRRINKFNSIKNNFYIPNIIDKTAIVSRFAKLSYGIFIGKRAIVNAGAFVNKGVVINTGAIVEHDCYIDDFVHVAPGAVLLGSVKIGKNSIIGSGSTIKQGITIGNNTIIGMGSVVLKNIPDNVVAFGNPCKEVKKHECIYNS